jgi:hypothetical protein
LAEGHRVSGSQLAEGLLTFCILIDSTSGSSDMMQMRAADGVLHRSASSEQQSRRAAGQQGQSGGVATSEVS